MLTDAEHPDVHGSDGEKILISAGPTRKPLPAPNDKITILGQSGGTVHNECGHEGPKWYQLNVYGSPTIKVEDRKYCPDCLTRLCREKSTRCSLCGLPIFSGEGVALYHESSGGLKYRKVATRVGDSFIGCLRFDCCPSGGFFAGHWTSDGFRSAFDEDETAASIALQTGKPVVGSTE